MMLITLSGDAGGGGAPDAEKKLNFFVFRGMKNKNFIFQTRGEIMSVSIIFLSSIHNHEGERKQKTQLQTREQLWTTQKEHKTKWLKLRFSLNDMRKHFLFRFWSCKENFPDLLSFHVNQKTFDWMRCDSLF